MRTFRSALLVACFGIAMFHEAKAATPDGAVTLIPPTCTGVTAGQTTWTYSEYIGITVNQGSPVATTGATTPAAIIVWHCFPSQAACTSAQIAAQNFTQNLGASATGSMQVGRIPLGCHTESN